MFVSAQVKPHTPCDDRGARAENFMRMMPRAAIACMEANAMMMMEGAEVSRAAAAAAREEKC